MRLEDKFKQLNQEGKKAFIAYFPFGFPKIAYTNDIFLALQKGGVDIIEFGFPFSDPLADGPIIQQASACALKQKITVDSFFDNIKKIKKDIKIPMVVMSYYNPVFQYKLSNFFKKAKENKISGTILVDLPFEESNNYIGEAKRFDIDPIFFITPTTSAKRVKKIAKNSKGFIYYVSITGITGPKALKYSDISLHIKNIKKITKTPVCVGFGIHNHQQVKKISSFSDGVIVGSEIVNFIDKHYKQKNFLKKLEDHVRRLRS
ncbi:MAG: tryptophan synthase subunit alpha [Candidatus Omnitrophica bacterium]|nr:tryptophan synthase subunit alpha [Candidatus Omnitrophota bacterium]MCF7893985.1 tryptophan synthase subunit alpha [Candidatus Omnitrophota bacterium]